jgi:hypothetical protein
MALFRPAFAILLALFGSCGKSAGPAGASLHRSRPDREGRGPLGQSGSAVTGAFGFGRGHSTVHPLARSNRDLTQHTVAAPRADQAPDCAHNPAYARRGLGVARKGPPPSVPVC